MRRIFAMMVVAASALLLAGCNTPQTGAPGGAVGRPAAKEKECWRWITQKDGTRFCERYDAPDY